MSDGGGRTADLEINPELLAGQVPVMRDLMIGITNIQTYLGRSAADVAVFGQTDNAGAAGTQFRQGYDTLRDSLSRAVQYASEIVDAMSATAGTTAHTDQQSAQGFRAVDEGR